MISQRILPKASVRAGGETDALDLGLKTRNDPVQQETKQRIARWRKKAAAIANRNPELNPVQIARRIQQSSAGKRKGGVLTYSITVIFSYLSQSPGLLLCINSVSYQGHVAREIGPQR